MASILKLLLIGICIYVVLTAFIYFRQSSL